MSENDPLDQTFSGSILIDGQAFDLSQLANLGWDEVDAVKSTRLPSGSYEFIIDELTMGPKEITPKDSAEKVNVLAIGMVLKVMRVFGIVQKPGEDLVDVDSLIEKKHFETFFVQTTESYGRFKQFLMDTGYVPTPEQKVSFQSVIRGAIGTRFKTRIKHSANRNDPEAPPYVNIRQDLVKPADEAA